MMYRILLLLVVLLRTLLSNEAVCLRIMGMKTHVANFDETQLSCREFVYTKGYGFLSEDRRIWPSVVLISLSLSGNSQNDLECVLLLNVLPVMESQHHCNYNSNHLASFHDKM